MTIIRSRNMHRVGFTLIELLVVTGIILVIAALAASFAPRVSDSQNLTRAVDQLEQWLLTAKMRAKRDGLATGVRFIQTPGDNPGTFSQLQYIQQPDPLSGAPGAGTLQSAANGVVTFVPGSVDFTLGGAVLAQRLVQGGDYLEVRDGDIYLIGSLTAANVLTLANTTAGSYDASLTITTPTTNYRILRQPRILIGESPLDLPKNFAVDMNTIPGTTVAATVANGSSGYPEILFSPTGAVVGTNAGGGKIYLFVHDVTLNTADIPNISGIVAVQCRTGFIGAYSVNTNTALGDPFYFAEQGRESGL